MFTFAYCSCSCVCSSVEVLTLIRLFFFIAVIVKGREKRARVGTMKIIVYVALCTWKHSLTCMSTSPYPVEGSDHHVIIPFAINAASATCTLIQTQTGMIHSASFDHQQPVWVIVPVQAYIEGTVDSKWVSNQSPVYNSFFKQRETDSISTAVSYACI